ncbi:hypothetical protein E0H73_39530 [Kribbella pittospori]|uniref:DUF2335 domain-containing protein n=1 Tax=Kribbella pittospori TaxID=722689 RepID=A0A4R0K602_9ACTN|nr:hypothetical protein [Kribbella pittospori]TCC54244.1 hypothetical protein E0H73_39530 [Kribbella pittospori]
MADAIDSDLGGSSNQDVARGRLSTARAAADQAARTLTRSEIQSLPAVVVQGLDTPAQQKAAAEEVVGRLPNEAKEDLAASVVQSLDTTTQKRAAAEGAVRALPSDQQRQLAQGVLGNPDRRTRQHLWYIVVMTMTAAIFVFGTMAFVLIYQGKAAEAPLALATTALGGVVGLVATSPGTGRSD